uniref:Uncharacterized protein n=1 Tax=Anguilla anguilla TaxID=7936 RepID=A0A0E9R2V8_ANGAN
MLINALLSLTNQQRNKQISSTFLIISSSSLFVCFEYNLDILFRFCTFAMKIILINTIK